MSKNTEVAKQGHLLSASIPHLCSKNIFLNLNVCFLYQVVPNLRVMKMIMKWSTWNTPATTAGDSLWAAE